MRGTQARRRLHRNAGRNTTDGPSRRKGRHALVGLLRQSVFGRLAGYEDVNNAERLRHNPAIRALRPGNVHSADGWDGVLKPVVTRYQGKVSRIYFPADAAFAMPEVYEFLESERIKYAIRLPANQVLQSRIGYLLTRPVGRPPHHVRRFHANFSYQAGTWTKPRRVIAKVEWHPGELYPRVG